MQLRRGRDVPENATSAVRSEKDPKRRIARPRVVASLPITFPLRARTGAQLQSLISDAAVAARIEVAILRSSISELTRGARMPTYAACAPGHATQRSRRLCPTAAELSVLNEKKDRGAHHRGRAARLPRRIPPAEYRARGRANVPFVRALFEIS